MVKHAGEAPLGEHILELRNQYETGQITRLELLRWGAMLGVSLPVLMAWAAGSQPARAATASMPEAAPRSGGILRWTAPLPTTVEPAGLTDTQGAATVQQVCEQLVRVGA